MIAVGYLIGEACPMRDLVMIREKIFNYLKSLNIEYSLLKHQPIFTCDDAKIHRPSIRGAACKSIFTRNKKGDIHYLIVLDAQIRVDMKSLRKDVGASALSFASEARLLKHLQTVPGSVSPFGLIFDEQKQVRVLLDRSLMSKGCLNFHPNDNSQTIEISTDDFQIYLDSLGHSYRLVDLL